MSRTKAKARRNEAGRQYRQNRAEKKMQLEEATPSNSTSVSAASSPPVAKKAKFSSNADKAVDQAHATITTPSQTIIADRIAANPPSTSTPAIPADVATTHDVTTMSIISSSHIQKKVTRILELLSAFSFVAPTKPGVVMLYGKAPVASKMITIVEIAKREIAQNGGKWFQYNKVEQTLMIREKIDASSKTLGLEGKGMNSMDLDEAEDIKTDDETTGSMFETMKTPFERAIEDRPKFRAIPVMTLYLSRVRVESLKKMHGEQTNALR